MSEPHLLYRVEKNIARFTINREPQRNAISLDAVTLFLKHLDEASTDPNVRGKSFLFWSGSHECGRWQD